MNAKVSLLLERMVVVLVVRRAPLPYGQLDTLTIGSRGISSCQVPERNDDQLPRGRLGCRGRSGPIGGASAKAPVPKRVGSARRPAVVLSQAASADARRMGLLFSIHEDNFRSLCLKGSTKPSRQRAEVLAEEWVPYTTSQRSGSHTLPPA